VKGGGFEVKKFLIDPKKPHARHNTWRVEHPRGRYLFIGPEPGKMLFTSLQAANWDSALGLARKLWFEMDPAKRDAWYGPKGKYAK
jgi:hypothetical protein